MVSKKIQDIFGYSNYQIAQLNFFFKTMLSELSKALIICILFYDKLSLFIWCLIIFHLMRSCTGGLHFKGYFSCLIASAIIFILSIRVLPIINIPKILISILLLLFILISYYIGPITSEIHLELSKHSILFSKIRLTFYIFIYIIIMFIIPSNSYLLSGFWVIVINTIQLIVAAKGGKRCKRKY